MVSPPTGTDVAFSSELEELASQTRAAPAESTPSLRDALNRAVALYVEQHDAGVTSIDHQGDLEALLGSQHAEAIRLAQRYYNTGRAQSTPDGPQGVPHVAADPVVMHLGAFTETATDLRISGAGIDFEFQRTYRSRAFYRGPLGANWDHSYNLWLREEGDSLVRSSGELREDRYVKHTRFAYWVPPDGYSDVITKHGDSFALTTPGGTRFRYVRSHVDTVHVIRQITSVAGHWLRFDHDEDDRLTAAYVNHPLRVARFAYDDSGRLAAVVAYPVHYHKKDGRTTVVRRWTYVYDEFEDLVAVRSPGTDQHPAGLTTRYEYSSRSTTGQAMHNLVRIIDSDGWEVIENEYGIGEGLVEFNRVVRQRQGSGEHSFRYEDVLDEALDAPPAARPAHQTTHVLPGGHQVSYVYNAFGNVLLKMEQVRTGCGLRTLAWRHAYDADGGLVATMTPDGSVTQFLYGRQDFYERSLSPGDPTVPGYMDDQLSRDERLRFGNRLASVRRGQRADLDDLALTRGLWGDVFPSVYSVRAEDVVVKYSYDGPSNRVATVSDPRFTESADPRHSEPPAYARHLTRYEYQTGLLVRFVPPETTYPSTLSAGQSGPGPATQRYDYDAANRLVRVTDPEGDVVEYSYHQDAGADRVMAGYLRSETRGAGVLDLTTSFSVNEVGLVTAVTDPSGAIERFVVDELDRTVEHRGRSSAHATSFRYDGRGRLIRQSRDAVGAHGTPLPGGPQVTTLAYDSQGLLIRESSGGAVTTRHLVTRHRYNASGQRSSTVLPGGNDIRYGYDERMLRTQTTRGGCGRDAATERTFFDGDGRVTERVDANGNVTVTRYDSLGRATVREDALGGLAVTDFDELDNIMVERHFERTPTGHALLSRRAFDYDERGGRIRETTYEFASPIPTPDPLAAPDAGFNVALGAGAVTARIAETFLDRNRRAIRAVNERGFAAAFGYDAAGRRFLERDPAGNETTVTFDRAGNPTRVDRREAVRDAAGAVARIDVFSTHAEFDALGRCTASVDALGNRSGFAYDSLDRLVRTVDPLGNVVDDEFDLHGRRVTNTRYLTATGRGGGTSVGILVTRFSHDPDGNLVSLTPPAGTTLEFGHDALGRRVHSRYAGHAPHETCQYDAAGNLVAVRDGAGGEVRTLFDPLNRAVRVDIASPGGSQRAAASFEEFAYDGLGRCVREANEWCEVRSHLDSLGRAWREEVRISVGGPQPPLVLDRSYDALGNVTALQLPSGRRFERSYDALARLTAVTNVALGVGYPGPPGTPPTHDVARLGYEGLRLATVEYGNGAAVALRYDGGARLFQIEHRDASGATLIRLQRIADGAGNTVLESENTGAGSVARARVFRYDSAYRLLRSIDAQVDIIDPAMHAPATAVLALEVLTGQQRLDAAATLAVAGSTSRSWTYDSAGNRVQEDDASGAVSYQVNGLSQYTRRDGAHLAYDERGALRDDGAHRYAFDHRGQLVEATDLAGPVVLELFRDTRGRPCAIRTSAGTTMLLHDGPHVVEEYAGGTPSAQYVYGSGMDQRLQVVATGTEHWFHCDHLGSTRLLTDATGSPTAAWSYDEFGLASPAAHPNPHLFCGKRLLPEVGHYDSRARTYSPQLGRFLERDPLAVSDGPNPYTYAGNNPRTFVDPLGTNRQQLEFDTVTVIADGRPSRIIETASAAARAAWNNGDEELARYYESEVQRLARVLARERHRETAEFAAAIYFVATTAALGGHAGGAAATAIAAKYGLGVTGTSLLVGGVSGATGSAAENLALIALGKNMTAGEFAANVAVGGATGLVLGGLSSWKAYQDFPINVYDRPGKAGWNEIMLIDYSGMITRPRGPRPDLDDFMPPKPGVDRAHVHAHRLGGPPDELFYASPRINRSHMAVYEAKAASGAQDGLVWAMLKRGGGRFSLEWRAYNQLGESIKLDVPDVFASPPRLGPTLKSLGHKIEFKKQ